MSRPPEHECFLCCCLCRCWVFKIWTLYFHTHTHTHICQSKDPTPHCSPLVMCTGDEYSRDLLMIIEKRVCVWKRSYVHSLLITEWGMIKEVSLMAFQMQFYIVFFRYLIDFGGFFAEKAVAKGQGHKCVPGLTCHARWDKWQWLVRFLQQHAEQGRKSAVSCNLSQCFCFSSRLSYEKKA